MHSLACFGGLPAIHDTRVVPSHSYKFVAMLQHVLAGYPGSPQRNPLILRVERSATHGAGAGTGQTPLKPHSPNPEMRPLSQVPGMLGTDVKQYALVLLQRWCSS